MTATEVQAVASWVPPTLLAGALGTAILIIIIQAKMQITTFIKQLKLDLAAFDKRLENVEGTLKEQDRAIVGLATRSDVDKLELRFADITGRLGGFMTTEQGGRLGDRMDGRITNIAERLAVLEATTVRK